MFPQKLKIELPYDPAAPLLGIYPKKTKTRRNICTPMFTAVFTTAKIRKQAKCPLMGEQRRCCVCTQWSITQLLKKETLGFVTIGMDTLEGTMLSEISQRKTNTI